jgi:hypothetical protein
MSELREIIEVKLELWGMALGEIKQATDEELLNIFIAAFGLNPQVEPKANNDKEIERMTEELRRLYGVERPFICGEAGEVGADGFKEYLLVCPSYGADGFAMYKKHKDYSAPGY